jgi:hypothetical protein
VPRSDLNRSSALLLKQTAVSSAAMTPDNCKASTVPASPETGVLSPGDLCTVYGVPTWLV